MRSRSGLTGRDGRRSDMIMELRPVKTKRIYEEIVDQISDLMAEGNLRPGDKLPSERDLAERLQVSRASVRDAIRALEIMGLIEIRPGEGTFVKDSGPSEIIQPLAMFIAVERSAFFEIYEVRKILETATARLAAGRVEPEELSRIEDAYKGMLRCFSSSDPEQGEIYDAQFHYAIAEAAHNNLLMKLMNTISETFHKSISTARQQLYLTPGNAETLLEQHGLVLNAIRTGDGETAAREMLHHLNYAEKELEKNLEDDR